MPEQRQTRQQQNAARDRYNFTNHLETPCWLVNFQIYSPLNLHFSFQIL